MLNTVDLFFFFFVFNNFGIMSHISPSKKGKTYNVHKPTAVLKSHATKTQLTPQVNGSTDIYITRTSMSKDTGEIFNCYMLD